MSFASIHNNKSNLPATSVQSTYIFSLRSSLSLSWARIWSVYYAAREGAMTRVSAYDQPNTNYESYDMIILKNLLANKREFMFSFEYLLSICSLQLFTVRMLMRNYLLFHNPIPPLLSCALVDANAHQIPPKNFLLNFPRRRRRRRCWMLMIFVLVVRVPNLLSHSPPKLLWHHYYCLWLLQSVDDDSIFLRSPVRQRQWIW